ncbi:porin, partial [Cypionkella sp.]|uniref:porin n=1 Tax=Cypionkella sp. TaxID=2811411 RepID=UPI002FDD1451
GYAAAEVKTTASVRMGVVSTPSVTAKAAGATAAADADAVVAAQADVNAATTTADLTAANTALAAAKTAAAASAAVAAVGSDVAFTSRVRIGFAASGETDNGLTFGASVRADQSGQGNTANGDSTVFISGAFGKLTMGDVSGAADAIVGQVSGVGFTGLGSNNEIGYLGNTKTAALYTYSAGALSFGLGLGQTTAAKQEMSVAVKYSTDAYSVAVGFEDNGTTTQTSALASATMSGVTVKAKVADKNTAANNAYALSADYSMSSVAMTAFYSSSFTKVGSYGVGASYDLGGGATVAGGVSKSEGAKSSFDLGVSMSF